MSSRRRPPRSLLQRTAHPHRRLGGAIGLAVLLLGVSHWGRSAWFADGFTNRQPTAAATYTAAAGGSRPAATSQRYSRAALDYFFEVAFGNEFSNNPDTNYIRKWSSSLRLSVRGGPTAADRATIARIVSELNQLLGGSVRILLTDQNPNAVMFFVPEAAFSRYDPNYVPRNLGFFRVWWNQRLEIQRARILISTTGVTQRERSHLIREELTQALGLMNDADTYRDSTFYQGWTETQDFSPLDRDLIQMLYDRRVRAGQTRDQVRQLFRQS